MAIDADTEVAPDAVEHIIRPLTEDSSVAAACGFVLPRHVNTVWERGRYVEYMFAFTFFKPIQDQFERPLISSGCFSAYRTDVLRQVGGWSNRTMAEDMDLTWTLYAAGYRVRFAPDAVCYPIEPHDFHFLAKQLKRWSHGFLQNVRLHWPHLIEQPYLRSAVAVGLWDATVASVAYLVLLPLLIVLVHPLFLLGYVIDFPAVAVPVLARGIARGELARALVSLPCFIPMRLVNAVFMVRAVWNELILGRTLLVYEKGH
jgi:biofilm PGA synthesis N-glycosyltransferase PgaC